MAEYELLICPECRQAFILKSHWNKKLQRFISVSEMLEESFRRNPKIKLVCERCGWKKWRIIKN